MSKKALLVGINNFTRPSYALRGCINDTVDMHNLLTSLYGFQEEDVKVLCDSQGSYDGIRSGLSWLLDDAAPGDVRVFHFSSHGTQVDDQGDDEWECKDEVIVPYDHDWDKPFRDDELREIFAKIPENVAFTFLADCCHSGSIQRELLDRGIDFIPRYITPPAEISERITKKIEARDAKADAYAAAQMATLLQGVPPDQWAAKMQEYLKTLRKRFKDNRYGVVAVDKHYLLAGCEDKQTSADARIGDEYRGAFTWGITKALREGNGQLTYAQLIKNTAANLKDYEQKPQLECPEGLRNKKVFSPVID